MAASTHLLELNFRVDFYLEIPELFFNPAISGIPQKANVKTKAFLRHSKPPMISCIMIVKMHTQHSHLLFRLSKLAIKTLEPDIKYVQS